MKVKDTGEFGLIHRISDGCVVRPENVIKGIGDDAAAFRPPAGEALLVTTDLLIEGVHFLRDKVPGRDLGHKALAVNLSDMAAMGGTPGEAFISIAIPDDCLAEYIEAIYDGMKALGGRFGMNILGGDTTRSKRDLVINVALMGHAPESEVLYRHGARPGDALYVTGYPGESRAGLHLILNGIPADKGDLAHLERRHHLPMPHIREGRLLAESGLVHAAIDISDGLSSDIGHIAEQSGVGIRLFADKIPLSAPLKNFCARFGFDPVEYALSGGEDYLLAFAAPQDQAEELERNFGEAFETPLFRIGEVIEAQQMELVHADGTTRPLTPSGWDHFSRR